MNTILWLLLAAPIGAQNAPAAEDYFKIQVVDETTGRGVPLVELRTTDSVRYYTDSNGFVAFHEPGRMAQDVYFHVESHGYEHPQDGFGFRGKSLRTTPGGSAEIRIQRRNVAERLYRVTGAGIYRDSVLLGERVPIEQPVLNALVTGQDSVHAAPYRGKIFWIWGDTNRPSYPLGNFGASGATSELPAPAGKGLDPAAGINLRYFVDDKGFSRPMVPADAISGPGPKWLGGLVTLPDRDGTERLVAKYVRVKSLGEMLERGMVIYNDEAARFDRLEQFKLDDPLYLDGHPARVTIGDREYLYCGYSPPYAVRVAATIDAVRDPTAYEGFSCLVEGTRFDRTDTELDRDANGRLRYGWKRGTPPLSFDQQAELIRAGRMKQQESWYRLEDIETGAVVQPHAGSVRWNDYRRRWVMIVEQAFGTSNLGEIWYAESDTPLGPWLYARKVVTHDKYSFYNPVHHAFFDQDGGRVIYFEGTYAELFSGAPFRTPWYDYNQIMYRLSLDDERVRLPAPVYRVRESGLRLREGIERDELWDKIESVAFFALPADRSRPEHVPVYAVGEPNRQRLTLDRPGGDGPSPLFWALPLDRKAKSDSVVALYEYRAADGSGWTYSTDPDLSSRALVRSEQPICRVWRNPPSELILEHYARPR